MKKLKILIAYSIIRLAQYLHHKTNRFTGTAYRFADRLGVAKEAYRRYWGDE
jgi:hypothetical protein